MQSTQNGFSSGLVNFYQSRPFSRRENTTEIKQAPRIFDYADQTSQRLKKNTYTTRK